MRPASLRGRLLQYASVYKLHYIWDKPIEYYVV